jgi:hypothetical protein
LAVRESSPIQHPLSELRWGSNSDSNKWIYNGLLPALVEPSIVVSIAGHTARA